MKLRRLITRRRAKWVGVAVCVCLATAMVASNWYWTNFSWRRAESHFTWSLGIVPGAICIFRDGWFRSEQSLSFTEWSMYRRVDLPSGVKGAHYTWIPKYSTFETVPIDIVGVFIPLWMLLLLIALPTAYLWHTDRRAEPWQCAKCRYDLRGLEGGECPECGEDNEAFS